MLAQIGRTKSSGFPSTDDQNDFLRCGSNAGGGLKKATARPVEEARGRLHNERIGLRWQRHQVRPAGRF
jgi:hypothetical protein